MKSLPFLKIAIIFLLCHSSFIQGFAQDSDFVKGVKYLLTFDNENEDSIKYDFSIIIIEGNAVSIPARAQFNSQMSIITPVPSNLEITDLFLPLTYNQNYTGTEPANFNISDYVTDPISQPGSNFFSVVPSVNPAAFYNNMYEGDTVKLFSFVVPGDEDVCNYKTRLYDNGIDPDNGAPGMGGGDFTNGFTIGGSAPKYKGNAYHTKYGVNALKVEEQTICEGDCATMTVEFICPDNILDVEWSNGFQGQSLTVCPEVTTSYTVQIETKKGQKLSAAGKVSVLPASDPACIVSSDDEALIHCEIHPNPTSDYVTIDSEHGISSIQIINASGQLMASYTYNSELAITLDMTQYTVGMYTLDLTLANGKKVNRQLVKQ